MSQKNIQLEAFLVLQQPLPSCYCQQLFPVFYYSLISSARLLRSSFSNHFQKRVDLNSSFALTELNIYGHLQYNNLHRSHNLQPY